MDYTFRRNGNLIRLNGNVPRSGQCPCMDGYCIGYFCDLGGTDDPRPDFHLRGLGENGEINSYTFPAAPFMGEVGAVYVIPFRQAWYGARINGLRLSLITLLYIDDSGYPLLGVQDGWCSVYASAEEAQAEIRRFDFSVERNEELDTCRLKVRLGLDVPDEFE